jgi:hypothetical protein
MIIVIITAMLLIILKALTDNYYENRTVNVDVTSVLLNNIREVLNLNLCKGTGQPH